MEKEGLLENILGYEWQMFMRVNDGDGGTALKNSLPTSRDFSDDFRLHRTSHFISWSEQSLASYLEDLKFAHSIGRNLMTYKYARMQNLLSCENESLHIAPIVSTLVQWQKEFIDSHPKMMAHGRELGGEEKGVDWASFTTYLQSELESYSEKTLELLHADVSSYQERGMSMSRVNYDYLAQARGYDSSDDAEARL